MDGKKKSGYYRDVAAKVDAMPDGIDPATERDALEEARQNAAENPVSKKDAVKVVKEGKLKSDKEVNFRSATTRRKFKFYRGAFLSVYEHLLAHGIKEATIARLFGVRFANLKQNGDKGVKQAYKKAMAELEFVLMANMLKQALGYEYTEVKTTYEPRNLVNYDNARFSDKEQFKKDIKPSKTMVKTKIEETARHYPGRPQLFLAYMATHFPEKWKIKGADGAGGVHFHITGEVLTDQLDKIAGKYLTKPVESTVIENETDQNND